MKLALEEFWGKRVGITWGNHFMHGYLSKEKSGPGYITLIGVAPYLEYRIEHDAIDSVGVFLDESYSNGN